MGFGTLLAVFVISIAITWQDTAEVRENSHFLASRVVPAMALSNALEREMYEFFLAVRLMQFAENEQAMAAVKDRMSIIRKTLDEIGAYHVANPELQTPKYIVEKVAPQYATYADITDKTAESIREKSADYAAMLEAGEKMTGVASQISSLLYAAMEEAIRSGDAERITKQLSLLRVGEDIALTVMNLRRAVLRAAMVGDISQMNATLDMIKSLEENIKILTPLADTAEKRQVLGQLRAVNQAYLINLQAYIELYKAVNARHESRLPLFEEVNKNSTDATLLALDRMTSVSESAVSSLGSVLTRLLVGLGVSVVLGALVAIFISRSITGPLKTIVELALRAGDGDLTVGKEDFHYDGKDELGVLVDAIAVMVAEQKGSMEEVVAVSENLMNSANNLSAISEETNASMEEIKSSIDQVSTLSESNGAALEECNAGIEEMSAGADTVAQSATDGAAFIAQTTVASNKAIQALSGVIKGMHGVDENAREVETKSRRLVSSVDNVSSFVSVITGIADQTNLLALNAAIEAARAGDVGRGFAVVAEEVRKLAEESARAARNVNGIIVQLQSGAQESIGATIEAGRMLSETLVGAEQVQNELNGVLSEMNNTNDSIQNIAAVAEEQAASSKEVASAIDSATKSTMEVVETISSIRRAAEETADAAQGVAEQSEAMTSHAQTLVDILSRFKLSAAPVARANDRPQALKALKKRTT
ncbi:MAG: methyl-accepting chemotaxis protein [Synergistaceae bacterium]|nr:methyl-accepting chemotaxis protein [Synergistaceae bacterium]